MQNDSVHVAGGKTEIADASHLNGNVPDLTQGEKFAILSAMVEGLHAMIYGTYTIGSGDFALKALGDGGSIHEYVHQMTRLLPSRCYEQIQSGGIPVDQSGVSLNSPPAK